MNSAGKAVASDAALRIWHGMRTLVLELDDRKREVAEATGMSFTRSKALRRLVAGPLTMRRLAEKLGTDAPYVTLVVDDLERLGLVERSANPDDRRSKLVKVTDAGREMAELAERILDRPPLGFADLDPDDLAVMDRVIDRLLATHGQM
jgi:DNA-binding MarR family transcriptional regulator